MAKINKKRSNTSQESSRNSSPHKKGVSKKKLRVKPWYKTRKWDLTISDMPISVLLQIFSYLSLEDLYLNVRLVNKKWYSLAASTPLWKTIKVGPRVPLHLILRWLENTPKLNTLQVHCRIDAGEILKKVHKYNKNIQQLQIHDCVGCGNRINLPSAALCNILLRCPYLNSISLRGCRFISCKFFRILATRDTILEKRKRNIDHNKTSKKLQYYGSALRKQLYVFLTNMLNDNQKKIALLTVEQPIDGEENVFQQDITVKSEEDIERVLNSLQFQ